VASSGQNFNQSVLLSVKPDAISQTLISGLSGVSGYTVTTAGPGSIILTRKYRPTWAIAVAVVGLLLFLLGILILLYTVTETTTITLTNESGGTRVTVSGVASNEMLTRVTGILSSIPALDTSITTTPPVVPVGSTDGPAISDINDEKTCPECGETVKAAAKLCRFCGTRFEPA